MKRARIQCKKGSGLAHEIGLPSWEFPSNTFRLASHIAQLSHINFLQSNLKTIRLDLQDVGVYLGERLKRLILRHCHSYVTLSNELNLSMPQFLPLSIEGNNSTCLIDYWKIFKNTTFKVQYNVVVKYIHTARPPVFKSLLHYLGSISIPPIPRVKSRAEKKKSTYYVLS